MRILAMSLMRLSSSRSNSEGLFSGKAVEAIHGRALQGFAKGIRGPGMRRDSYVLSDSLREKIKKARHSVGEDPVPEVESSIQVASLSGSSPADWPYYRRQSGNPFNK